MKNDINDKNNTNNTIGPSTSPPSPLLLSTSTTGTELPYTTTNATLPKYFSNIATTTTTVSPPSLIGVYLFLSFSLCPF